MPDKVFIVGAFQEIIELTEECGYKIIGLIDREITAGVFAYPVLCDDTGVTSIAGLLDGSAAVLTPDSPDVRRKLRDLYQDLGFPFASLISPRARVSSASNLGEAVIAQWNVHISAGTTIGGFTRLNVGANIMHDAIIGDFSTIAPNATVLGRVRIGMGCYIGANSTLLPGISIGDNAIVGAGSVVTRNVPERTVVAGNPARILRPIHPQDFHQSAR